MDWYFAEANQRLGARGRRRVPIVAGIWTNQAPIPWSGAAAWPTGSRSPTVEASPSARFFAGRRLLHRVRARRRRRRTAGLW